MRIKKIATSIGVAGKVLNEKSDSKKDTYSCDYINKLHTYSTSPVKIGTSDDGQDRYRIVVKGTTPTQSDWVAIKTFAKNLKIKVLSGTISDYLPIPCYINSEYYVNFQYNPQNGNLFCMARGYTNVPFELTIEYEI